MVPGEELKERIRSLCSDVKGQLIDEFFHRMDEDYFSTFVPEQIATHIRMSAELGPKRRIIVRVTPLPGVQSEFEIVIVGFDYLSEFSIFCGLLSAFGL